MADFKIKQGYTVPIKGEAHKELTDVTQAPFLGVCPVAFPGLKPKLSVQVNDEVKVGSPLFFDKQNPETKFLSPGSGRITAINYGPRRVIEEIIIATGEGESHESFDKHVTADIPTMERDELIGKLQAGGMWPYIRRRPFNKIAKVEDKPKAIFVNCMDTAPLAADPNFCIQGKDEPFAAGIAALSVLATKVHLACSAEAATPFRDVKGSVTHTFSGQHPAGLTGTHIDRISPINKGEVVWHLTARDVVMIGSFLLEGRYPTERIVAVAGPGAKKPCYVRARLGMKIKDIVNGNQVDGEMRFISGNVLSGTTKSIEGFLDLYDNLVTILPEGREQQFIGWMLPGADRPSYTRNFLSGIIGRAKKFAMNTNINGGHRAIIQSGMWEEVVALDLHPEFLVKATMAEDIDAMEQLGILECDPEDFALCTYICPSKTEVSTIIAKGLELMEKEG